MVLFAEASDNRVTGLVAFLPIVGMLTLGSFLKISRKEVAQIFGVLFPLW
jgi:hypothetical protein